MDFDKYVNDGSTPAKPSAGDNLDLFIQGVTGAPGAALREIKENPVTTIGGAGLAIGLGLCMAEKNLLGSLSRGAGTLLGAAYMGDVAFRSAELYNAFEDNSRNPGNWNQNLATAERVFGRFTIDAGTMGLMGSAAGVRYLTTKPAIEVPKLGLKTSAPEILPSLTLADAAALRAKSLPLIDAPPSTAMRAADVLPGPKPAEPAGLRPVEVLPPKTTEISGLKGVETSAPSFKDGTSFEIVNPKTGERWQTVVRHLDAYRENGLIELQTPEGVTVAKLRFNEVIPSAENPSPRTLFGEPRAQKSHLYFDFMSIEPSFQGKGVRESVVEGLRKLSIEMGHNGRIKAQCVTDYGSVSAIAMYKAGFRPQEGAVFFGEKFATTKELLASAVQSGRRVSLEEGRQFDNILMYLPER